MLPDDPLHGLLRFGDAVLIPLDLCLGLLELGLCLRKFFLKIRNLLIQGLNLRLKVILNGFFPLDCLFVRLFDLCDNIGMVLLLLGNLSVKVCI